MSFTAEATFPVAYVVLGAAVVIAAGIGLFLIWRRYTQEQPLPPRARKAYERWTNAAVKTAYPLSTRARIRVREVYLT